MPRILFVSGFHPSTRAKDLAFEFERYGPLVRCDVPAPRNSRATHTPYAFVEFRSARDAEDAWHDMHGRYFEGMKLSVQWAKNPPSSVWRYDRRSPPPRRDRRSRSRSPRRDDRDRRRSRSPIRRRSLSPRKDDRERDRDDRDRDMVRDDRDKDKDREDRDRGRDRERDYERPRSPLPERKDDANTNGRLDDGR